jgi:hypothetical protein
VDRHLLAVDLLTPEEVVRSVVQKRGIDMPKHTPQSRHGHHRQEHAIREGEIGGMVERVVHAGRCLAVPGAVRQNKNPIARMRQRRRVRSPNSITTPRAAGMPERHRARMHHDRDGTLLQTPGVGDGAVDDPLHSLNFDKVIATPDAADLAVA